MVTNRIEVTAEPQTERWVNWPVYWSAIWVGMLTALAVGLDIGLVGIATGMHLLGPQHRMAFDWKAFKIGALVFSVFGAFFAFAAGGWVAGKIAGFRLSEPAMLHGAIVWLLAVPFMVLMVTLGAGGFYGGWYNGLAGAPAWVAAATPEAKLPANATAEQKSEANHEPAEVPEEKAREARNGALGAVTALLISLIGSVIGGWMASGEPMTFTHYRHRHLVGRAGSARTVNEAPAVR
jgi:hypothetical protein